MFAHGEVLLAGVFGLVHGMAFATTILEMNRAKNTSHLGTATGVPGHDEQLVQGFGRGTDPVGDIGEFQLAKEVEQADWSRAIVCLCLSVRDFDRYSLTIARWLTTLPGNAQLG